MYFRLTPTVKILLIVNFVVFLIHHTMDMYLGGNFIGWFGFIPYTFIYEFRIWQILTYAFLHASVMHLLLNLLILTLVGSEMEAGWGRRRFIQFYLVCAVGAGVFYLLMQLVIADPRAFQTPMIGASGAIYGLLAAYGMIYGERTLLFMLLFPMKAKHFIWILIGVELMTTVFSPGGGWSAVAHLGGLATGFLYLVVPAFLKSRIKTKKFLDSKRLLKKKRSHLRVVRSPEEEVKSFDDEDEGPKTWH